MPHDLFKPNPTRKEEKWKTYSPTSSTRTIEPEQTTQQSNLFALPLELRLDIYDLLIFHHHHNLDLPARDLNIATALLYTCRQIFAKIAPYIPKILLAQMKPLEEECKAHEERMSQRPDHSQMGYVNCKYLRDILRVHIERIQKRLVVAKGRVECAGRMGSGQCEVRS